MVSSRILIVSCSSALCEGDTWSKPHGLKPRWELLRHDCGYLSLKTGVVLEELPPLSGRLQLVTWRGLTIITSVRPVAGLESLDAKTLDTAYMMQTGTYGVAEYVWVSKAGTK